MTNAIIYDFRPVQTGVLPKITLVIALLIMCLPSKTLAQNTPSPVIITGTRFTYPLIQKWIDDYNKVNPDVQIIIESRGSTDPRKFDILAEVYELPDDIKKEKEFIHLARYAILPVAVAHSPFAKVYEDKGLTRELIRTIYFTDLTSTNEKDAAIKVPYTIYTRLQRAGVPIVFTNYFGYEQRDIKGKAIAGADEHLLKAFLRDSNGITYLPLSLAYDLITKKPHDGLVVIPVDLNGNGRVSSDEKIYDELPGVIAHLETYSQKDIHNVPLGSFHLSISKTNANPQALAFLKWVVANGQNDLHDFGFLKPEEGPSAKGLGPH